MNINFLTLWLKQLRLVEVKKSGGNIFDSDRYSEFFPTPTLKQEAVQSILGNEDRIPLKNISNSTLTETLAKNVGPFLVRRSG